MRPICAFIVMSALVAIAAIASPQPSVASATDSQIAEAIKRGIALDDLDFSQRDAVNGAESVLYGHKLRNKIISNGVMVISWRTYVRDIVVIGSDAAQALVSYVYVSERGGGKPEESIIGDSHQFRFKLNSNEVLFTADQILDISSEGVRAIPIKSDLKSISMSEAKNSRAQSLPLAKRTDRPMEAIDIRKFVEYALRWTASDAMNPNYPEFNNNCANFTSQTLHEAGRQYRISRNWLGIPRSSNPDSWSPDLPGLLNDSSYSWGGANAFFNFAWNHTNVASVRYFSDFRPGDVIAADWSAENNLDGVINHMAVVTGLSRDSSGRLEPRLSQKTANRRNVAFSDYEQQRILNGDRYVDYYGIQLSATSGS
jgi:hypothetical protein